MRNPTLTESRFLVYYLHRMAIDWSKQYRDHRGQWVALRKDEVTVVASGKTAKEVLNRARAKGYKKPILFRVPTKIIPYIGGIGQ